MGGDNLAAVGFEVIADGIALVTLQRPERLNAIDGSLIDGMDAALDRLASGEFRVGITGAGRGFMPGPT
jgi:enoyl-CoA hydratase/carnithine racemase